MPTHPNTWKAAERRVAALFGALRQRLSGSSGRPDTTAADTTHPALFIEVKYRETHAARTLFDKTRRLATIEGKVPVVALVDKRKPGFLLCLHVDDLPLVYGEFAKAQAARPAEGHREPK